MSELRLALAFGTWRLQMWGLSNSGVGPLSVCFLPSLALSSLDTLGFLFLGNCAATDALHHVKAR